MAAVLASWVNDPTYTGEPGSSPDDGASLALVTAQMASVYRSLLDIQAQAHAQLDSQSLSSWVLDNTVVGTLFTPSVDVQNQQAGGLEQLDGQVQQLDPQNGRLGIAALRGATDDGYPYDPAKWQAAVKVVFDGYAYDISQVTGKTATTFDNLWSGLALPIFDSAKQLGQKVADEVPKLPAQLNTTLILVAVVLALLLFVKLS